MKKFLIKMLSQILPRKVREKIPYIKKHIAKKNKKVKGQKRLGNKGGTIKSQKQEALLSELLKLLSQVPKDVKKINKKEEKKTIQLNKTNKKSKSQTEDTRLDKKRLERFKELSGNLPFGEQKQVQKGKVVRKQALLKKTSKRIEKRQKSHVKLRMLL